MEIQYTCGHRQVTQLHADGKHPYERLELKPGESVTSKLKVSPASVDSLVIDANGPISVSAAPPIAVETEPADKSGKKPKATPAAKVFNLTRPMIWQNGNGIAFPFGQGSDPLVFTFTNPSETDPVNVLIVSIPTPTTDNGQPTTDKP